MENYNGEPFRRGQFNTLAQTGTMLFEKPALIVSGNGSDLSNTKGLKGKAQRKFITQKMVLGLIENTDKYGNSENKKPYWNTFHCQNTIYTVDGKIHSRYCKNRFCTVCCANRKADIMNRYLPIIRTWENPHMVTLTVKSIPGYRLRLLFKKVLEGFNRIKDKYRKRSQRGTGNKLIGIKSLESNFNPKTKRYNPHLHIIVANEEMAYYLKVEWLILWKKTNETIWTNARGQKITKIENKEAALIEVVKYGSKIFTEPDVKKKVKGKGDRTIHIAALDNIFNTMKGIRIFDRFGFNLPKQDREIAGAKVVKNYEEWNYEPKKFDWINSDNCKPLSEYTPESQLIYLLENHIENKLE